jgi:hypothetical protein
MINWRNGKAGFVGGLKYLIKGFFSYQHSVTSADVAAGHAFGVVSLIDDSGQGLSSAIDATGQGVNSLITASFGVLSLIDNSGQGLTSLIDTEGEGVESDI